MFIGRSTFSTMKIQEMVIYVFEIIKLYRLDVSCKRNVHDPINTNYIFHLFTTSINKQPAITGKRVTFTSYVYLFFIIIPINTTLESHIRLTTFFFFFLYLNYNNLMNNSLGNAVTTQNRHTTATNNPEKLFIFSISFFSFNY